MTTTERLLRAAEPIWAGYHTHPFVRGIRDGTLDREKFRFYMIQDYRYLVEYSKVFAVGIAKGTRLEVMQLFASYIQAILNEEMNIHNAYVGLLNITQEELDAAPMTLENRSYTAYMLAQAYAGGEAEVLTAILSCAVSYEEIGRRMVREHGVKCIGVDYLQLMRSTSRQAGNSREREVSEISAGLKSLAKELNIPVLVLAQLNRDVEKRAGNAQGKPVVSDLRDSGSIEQDADQIIMIHRPYMYKPDKHDPTEAQWIIGKNRFGRLGRIQFRWTAELTKYEEEQNYPVTNK